MNPASWKHVASTTRNDSQYSHTVGAERNFVRLAIIISDAHELQENMQPKKEKEKEQRRKQNRDKGRKVFKCLLKRCTCLPGHYGRMYTLCVPRHLNERFSGQRPVENELKCRRTPPLVLPDTS